MQEKTVIYLTILIQYRHRNSILFAENEVNPELLKAVAKQLTPENGNPSDADLKLLNDIRTLASTGQQTHDFGKALKEVGAEKCSEKLLDLPGLMLEDTDRIKSQCMERIRKSRV